MEFFFGAGLFGLSLAFWIIAVIGFLIVTSYANSERFARSIGILLIFGIALLYLGGVGLGGLYTAIVADPVQALIYVGYFIAIGIVYTTVRWWSKIMRVRRKLIAYRAEQGIEHGVRMTQDQRDRFLDTIHERYSQQIPLRVRDNKARITFWMMFWPVSLPISLRPITRFFEFLYNQIAGFLQSISNRAFRDLA